MVRITSMPARADATAASSTSATACTAAASSESVIATPSKPSSSRSRPSTMAGDCEAMCSSSSAGYVAWPTITNSVPMSTAITNGWRSSSSWSRVRSITAGPSSVLTVAPPRPGKCLTVVATPPSCQPPIDSATAAVAASGSVVKARSAIAAPSTVGMSATGASVTETPAARRSRPAASESSRTVPQACCSGAARSGSAHGTMRIAPPSWSTQISAPAARRGAGRA